MAGTARRAGLSAAGKSLSGKSLWKKVEEVDSAEGEIDTTESRARRRRRVSRDGPATSLRQALTRCRCRMVSGDAGHGQADEDAALRRSAWGVGAEPRRSSGFREQRGVQQERSVEVAIATPFPEAVACSVPDLVMSIGITGDVRREHDTAGG